MRTFHLAVFFFFLLYGPLTARAGWERHRAVWEPLLGMKSDISVMIGGDINGDDRDDIVVIYKSGPNKGLSVLMTEGEGYRPVRFNDLGLDFIKNADITNAAGIGLVNGVLELVMPLDLKKILPSVRSNEQAVLAFSYADPFRQILLERVTANVSLDDGAVSGGGMFPSGKRTHLYFHVLTGGLFWKTILREETADRPASYKTGYYHRFIAKRLDAVSVDARKSENEWLAVPYPAQLRNVPEGNYLGSGFEAWKGDHDLSARVYTGYNAGYFFLYAQVADDAVFQSSPGNKMADGDHILLRFASTGSDETQIALSPGNFSSVKPEAFLWRDGRKTGLNKKLGQVILASRKAVDGYVLEARIPANYLPSGYISSASSLFSVTLFDKDGPALPVKSLSSSAVKDDVPYRLGRIFWE